MKFSSNYSIKSYKKLADKINPHYLKIITLRVIILCDIIYLILKTVQFLDAG